jgi:hypothetical protein
MSLPLFKRTSFLVIWSVFGRFLTEDWSVSVMQAATDRDKPAATPVVTYAVYPYGDLQSSAILLPAFL